MSRPKTEPSSRDREMAEGLRTVVPWTETDQQACWPAEMSTVRAPEGDWSLYDFSAAGRLKAAAAARISVIIQCLMVISKPLTSKITKNPILSKG
jgi:hypothetical protein